MNMIFIILGIIGLVLFTILFVDWLIRNKKMWFSVREIDQRAPKMIFGAQYEFILTSDKLFRVDKEKETIEFVNNNQFSNTQTLEDVQKMVWTKI